MMFDMTWQAVFFDFDGVILDSVDIKTRAFTAMFRPFGPDIEKAVTDYHLANGGVSRFEKFRYYYTHLLNQPPDDHTLAALGEQFQQQVFQQVLDAPFIPGAKDTLNTLTSENIPCFVVSGTPDEEIRVIVERRGLGTCFQEVHGSPDTKEQIVNDICKRHGFLPEVCLFIGDAMTDYHAARQCGTRFMGIVQPGSPSPFPEGTWINDHLVLSHIR
jgi:HAD superfamily hydrolase (TIGR01549 family)